MIQVNQTGSRVNERVSREMSIAAGNEITVDSFHRSHGHIMAATASVDNDTGPGSIGDQIGPAHAHGTGVVDINPFTTPQDIRNVNIVIAGNTQIDSVRLECARCHITIQ